MSDTQPCPKKTWHLPHDWPSGTNEHRCPGADADAAPRPHASDEPVPTTRSHGPYVYSVEEVVRIVDGDTVDLRLQKQDRRRPVFASPWTDQGFHVDSRVAWFVVDGAMSIEVQTRKVARIRLLDADTPEMNAKDPAERERAVAATAYTTEWLHSRGDIVVVTSKSDSFGRYLGIVDSPQAFCSLNEALIADGHAVRWSKSQAD